MGYTKDAIKSISWVGAFRVSMRAITLVRTAILARLLTPSQFGTFGIALLVLGLVEMATETGINVFLIQKKEAIDEYVDTAWIASITRGIIIALLIIFSAPIVASFFASQEAWELLFLTSIVPFMRGFINPSLVRFQKELSFDREFWFKSGLFFVESIVTVVLAFFTREASSIIWGLIASSFLEVILSFMFLRPRPHFRIQWDKMRAIIKRGKWMTAASIFNYLFYNGDNIVVGKILGVTPLGIYQMGYRLATLPITEVADVVTRVTFPVYTKIADDKARLKIAFFKTLLTVFTITLPFGLILLFFPKLIVEIILGDQWMAVVPVVQVLALFGVIRAVSSVSFALFLALDKQEYVSLVTLVGIISLFIAIVPLVLQYGIVGAAIAAFIASLVPLPVIVFLTRKVLP